MTTTQRANADSTMTAKIAEIKTEHPTWGYRRIAAYLQWIGYSDATEYKIRIHMAMAQEVRRAKVTAEIGALVATCDACSTPTPQAQLSPIDGLTPDHRPTTFRVCTSCRPSLTEATRLYGPQRLTTCDACGQLAQAQLSPLPWTDEHGTPRTAMVCPSCAIDTTTDVGLIQGTARRHF